MQTPTISVIIVSRSMNPNLEKCIRETLSGSFKNFEIIVILDGLLPNIKFDKTRFFRSVQKGPAKKRDFAAQKARGKIIAFIDDDAYPAFNWLKYIYTGFNQKNISAVCGPGVTPPDVNWREEASGWVSASPLGSGQFSFRFIPGRKKFVDDYPSMNLAALKADFDAIGGYDSNYYPGEDTKLCLDIVYKLKKKILYEPKAVVYHHRREIMINHLKQHGGYGIHRGFFAKKLPETSARFTYFLPSIFSLINLYILLYFLFKSRISIEVNYIVYRLYILCLISVFIYGFLLLLNSLWVFFKSKKIFQAFLSLITIYLTHIWYGIRFIQGFMFTKSLKI